MIKTNIKQGYMQVLVRTLVVFVALLFVTGSVLAQAPTGTILGVVRDATGGTVAGAAITVTNLDTGLIRTGATGEDGAYRFPALPVGKYTVRVMKEGFQVAERQGFTLEVGQEAAIDATLQVGSTGQTVTVTEEAPLVNTTSSAVGNIVSEQEVADLPLNGRNFTDLTLLQTGVAQNVQQGNVFGINGTFYSSNGAPTRSNNYLLDGAVMQNIYALNNSSIAGTSLGVDGVKEYRVLTSMFGAEYGLVMGSQTIIVSKNGTNGFHGSVFEYLRNSAMDARNYFDLLDLNNVRGFGPNKSLTYPGKRIPPFQRNNFGASIGGPIKKDKTFFFATYEGLRENKDLSIVDTTLPAACFTNGTFFAVNTLTEPVGCGSTATVTNTMNPVMQKIITLDQNGNPFSTSAFPSGGLWPAPLLSTKTKNFSYPATQRTNEDYGQFRLDENFSGADSAFARFTEDKTGQYVPGSFPQAAVRQWSISEFATASETHIFSPTLLNTARVSYSRTGYTIVDMILPNNEVKSYVAGRVFGSLAPGGGVTSFGTTGRTGRNEQIVYSTSDDLFLSKGKHSFKFGLLWDHWNSFVRTGFTELGNLSFPGDLPSFFAGSYSAAGWAPAASDSTRDYIYDTLGFYAQDDFRVTPRLTLNLGLRYEFLAKVPYESSGHNAEIDIATAAPPTFGKLNVPFLKTNPSLHNFSPRVGFAWDVFGNGKTSLRGGAGIFYDVANLGSEFAINSLSTEPYSYFYTLTNNSATDPLVYTAPGVGLLDNPALVPPGGCSTVVIPAFTPCASSTSLWDVKSQPSFAQWNLTIDRQLPWNIGVTAGYIGSAGWHIYRAIELDPNNVTITPTGTFIPLQHLANGLPVYCQTGPGEPAGTCLTTLSATASVANPYAPPATLTGAQAAINAIANLQNFERVNPTLSSGSSAQPAGNIWYHSFQLTLTKRVSQGLSFQSSYTFAKSLDTGSSVFFSDGGTLAATDGNIDNVDKGPTVNNIKHLWRLNAIYAIPGPKSDKLWAKPLTGWNVSAIWAMQTGYPLTAVLTTCTRNVFCDGGVASLPDKSSTYNASTIATGNPGGWFDPTMFALPPAGQIGNAGRGNIIGPATRNLNFSTSKSTKIHKLGEQGALDFRADFFNLFNHPLFARPNTTVFSVPGDQTSVTTPPGPFTPSAGGGTYAAFGSAGLITATAGNSRQMQLSLRLSF